MSAYFFPPDIVPQRAQFGLMRMDAVLSSPLNGVTQRIVRGGAGWVASLEWETIPTRAKAQRLSAYLAQAGRGDNLIVVSDPSYTAQGAVSGVLTVAGGSQTGTSLAIDGCVAGATVFEAGDYFTVGGELKQVTQTCVASATGTATVYFEPALRSSPTDNAFLYAAVPTCAMYLAESPVFSHRAPKISSVSVGLREAVGSESETAGPYIDLVRGANDLGALSPLATVTRASTKYLLSASGTLASFASNVAGFEWNASAALLGLSSEGARTNLCTYSQDPNNAAWTKTDTVITNDSIAAPDGTTTADLATEGTAGTALTTSTAMTITANATVAKSVFFKAGTATWIRVYLAEAAATTNRVSGWFNVSTGAVGSAVNGGTATGGRVEIEALASGWYRCTVVGAVKNGATSVNLNWSSASADASTTRVNNATYYPWGAQVENSAPYQSSYIPTTTASVTRAADVISVASISTALGFNATEGAIFCEFSVPYVEASAAAARYPWSLNDGTNNERIFVRTPSGQSDIDALGVDGGSTQFAIDGPALSSATAIKIALAWRTNDIAYYASGASVGTDAAATLPTMTTFNIGHEIGSLQLFGHIKNLRYYPRRLTNAELATLTT